MAQLQPNAGQVKYVVVQQWNNIGLVSPDRH